MPMMIHGTSKQRLKKDYQSDSVEHILFSEYTQNKMKIAAIILYCSLVTVLYAFPTGLTLQENSFHCSRAGQIGVCQVFMAK